MADFAILYVIEDNIAKLYVTQSSVKWREVIDNVVT